MDQDTETTTVNNDGSKEGDTMPCDTTNQIETSNEGNDTVTKDEQATGPEEENTAIQLRSTCTETDTIVKEKSIIPENEDTSTATPPLSSSCTESLEKSPVTQEEGPSSEVQKTSPDNDVPEKKTIDPWAIDGEYATFLSQNKNMEVYYIQDEAKLIDTGLIMRSSGKGCDASNIYDEEILNTNEAYYSDDEKEREAKNKKKKGGARKKAQQRNDDRQQQQQQSKPGQQQQQQRQNNFTRFPNNAATGHYASGPPPPPPPPAPQQGYGYNSQHAASLPQGFHHTAQAQPQQHPPQGGFQQQQQPYPSYQYPAQSSFHRHGAGPPPPPPPPPGHYQSYPYQGMNSAQAPQQATTQTTSSTMGPPPPPPRNPNEPPAYQY